MMRYALTVALLCAGLQMNAQKLFDIGFKAGINRDNIRLSNVADHRAVLGWNAGLFVRVKPPLAPGFQGELLYSTQGTDLRISDSIPSEASIRLNYLQMPLFLVFSLGPAEVHLGGYASYLLGTSISQPANVYGEALQLKENQFQSMDYGLLGGAGLRLSRFYVGGRYLLGLGTVGEGITILRDSRNIQAQLYIGIGLVK